MKTVTGGKSQMLWRMTVCSGNLRDISQMTWRREKARWGSDYRTVDKVGALGRVVSLMGSGQAAFQRHVSLDGMHKDRAQSTGWLQAKINLLCVWSVTSHHHLPG